MAFQISCYKTHFQQGVFSAKVKKKKNNNNTQIDLSNKVLQCLSGPSLLTIYKQLYHYCPQHHCHRIANIYVYNIDASATNLANYLHDAHFVHWEHCHAGTTLDCFCLGKAEFEKKKTMTSYSVKLCIPFSFVETVCVIVCVLVSLI